MLDQELYQIANQRINRRNRRWTLWSINLAILIISVAAMIFLSDTFYDTISLAFMLGWAGIFVMHTIILGMASSRDDDVEKEVAKLRELAEMGYEKPKRLHLTDDGEISDDADWAYEEAESSRKSR